MPAAQNGCPRVPFTRGAFPLRATAVETGPANTDKRATPTLIGTRR